MADCFSLPNAAKLVGELRDDYKAFGDGRTQNFVEVTLRCKKAADAIEQLLAENAKLKTERDAAVADFTDLNKQYGAYCRYCKGSKCGFKAKDGWCAACPNYEWRGVVKEEEK